MNKIIHSAAAKAATIALAAVLLVGNAIPAKAATLDQLQAQITALLAQLSALQGSSAAMTFTQNLTLGSSGAEVTALQNFLINHGYSVPAGATGYFGAQTKNAVAAFQAAKGITPASGYFGPLTRSAVNAMSTSTGSTGTGSTSGGLSGGEADFRNFDLKAGDDIREGDSNKEIAIATFDVKGGDARVQRVTVDFQAVSGSYSQKPWDYVDSLAVYLGNKKIGDVDAGSKSDWDRQDDDSDHSGSLKFYTIDIPVDGVVKEGAKAELSIRADAQGSIDGSDENQTFKVQIPTDGIRAVDAKGIQQYAGNGEEITLGFNAALNGDLTVKKSSNNPAAGVLVADATATSDAFDVLAFEIKNADDADATLNDLTVTVATSSSAGPDANITNIIRRATLTSGGKSFTGDIKANNTITFKNVDASLDGDDTTKFMVSVQLFGQSGHFPATGQSLTFSVASANVDAEGADTGDASSVSGTATGNEQAIAVNGGISVATNSVNAVQTYNSNTTTSSYGTFTLKFDVTAVGDDVYVPKGVDSAADTFGHTASTSYVGAVIDTAMSASTTDSAITMAMTSTADSENAFFYVVREGDTETFTVTVTINPNGADGDLGVFQIGLDKVKFSSTSANLNSLQTLEVDQSKNKFHTDPIVIQG